MRTNHRVATIALPLLGLAFVSRRGRRISISTTVSSVNWLMPVRKDANLTRADSILSFPS
jgi:hypothetical protein